MKKGVSIVFLFLLVCSFSAQENTSNTKFTDFLSKSYYSINFGGIFHSFLNDNLAPGYSSPTVSRNWFSGRMLLGHKFAENWAFQFGTLRPAAWFKYDNVNGVGYENSVWINAWTLSLKKDFNIAKNTTVYTEVGIANVTRVGFSIGNNVVYDDAHFGSVLYSLGLQYWLSKKWRLSANGTLIPKKDNYNQPAISQASFGFEYHLQQLDDDTAEKHANNKYFFPNNIFQISYGSGTLGYGMNEFFSMNMKVGNFKSFGVPIFWLGEVRAAHAVSVTYQKLIYRSEKIFSLDWGVSATYFQSTGKQDVFAFSIFPVLRFYLFRKNGFDFYTNYSIIGPTFISESVVDNFDKGTNFTYQDTMGFGVFFGKERKYNFELRIMHYSNGNIFTDNAGVAIPLQFTFGKTF